MHNNYKPAFFVTMTGLIAAMLFVFAVAFDNRDLVREVEGYRQWYADANLDGNWNEVNNVATEDTVTLTYRFYGHGARVEHKVIFDRSDVHRMIESMEYQQWKNVRKNREEAAYKLGITTDKLDSILAQ